MNNPSVRVRNGIDDTQLSCFEMRLREERERLQLSQRALGKVGGVEANAQGKYESGARVPKADYLAALASIGVDVVFLITGKRIPLPISDISSDEQKMMLGYRLLQREDQDALSWLANSLAYCYSTRHALQK